MFEIALKKKDEEKPLGNGFGGGWGLSELVKEKKPVELKASAFGKADTGIKASTGNTASQFDIALKTPPVEIIEQEEQALAKAEEIFSALDKTIETDYKRYQELGKQLDDLETQITDAPQELQWNLSLKYENLRAEHNQVVDRLQTNTEEQKKVYQDYKIIRGSYEKDIEIYNRKIEAQNKEIQEQHQNYLDTSRLQGSMKPGEGLPKTHEQQLKDKFTTPPEKTTVGGMAGISEPLDLSKVSETSKKVIQAIGGVQGLKITEPEIYQQAMDIKNQIYEFKDPLERIAKAHEMLTGEPMEESLKEIQAYEPPDRDKESGFKPSWISWYGHDPAVYGKSAFGMIQLSPKELPEKYQEALGLVSQASQFTGIEQAGSLLQKAAYGVLIGNMAYSGIKALYEAGKVSELRTIGQKKIFNVIEKAKDIFEKQKAGEKVTALNSNEMEILRNAFGHWKQTGEYPTTMKVPQVTFLGQKGGIDLPNLAKAIQSAGKITPDIKNQLSIMTFANKIEAMNQLNRIDPTLAATLATDFGKILETPETPEAPAPETPTVVERPEIPVTEPAREEVPREKIRKPEVKIPTREKISQVKISEPVMEKIRQEPKFPEIVAKINEEILPKVNDVIEQEILRAEVKIPDRPVIKEKIMPVVEKAIEEVILPRTEVKLPDIPVIEREVLTRVREAVKEVLPRVIPKQVEGVTIPMEEMKPVEQEEIQMPETRIEPKAPVTPEIPEKIVNQVERVFHDELPKAKIKAPEMPQIKQNIIAKVEQAIDETLPRVEGKAPEITIPQKEEIIVKVREVIDKELPRYAVKAPDVPNITQKIIEKVDQVIKEEMPELKAEVKIPEKIKQKVISEIVKAPDPVEKIRTIKEETQHAVDKMIDDHTAYLIETSGKGVDRGLIPKEEGGYTRYAVSQNPVWYQELYRSLGKTPTKADLRAEAERQLRDGLPDENISPDPNFIKLEAQLEAWEMAEEELENIVDLTEPKVIERVIERVVEKQAKTPKPKPKPIKTQIREITGQSPPEKIEIRERDILKYVLRGEARVARQVFKTGKEEGIFQQKEHFEDVVARAKERKAKSEEVRDLRKVIDNVDLKKLRPERKANIEKIISEFDPAKMTGKTMARLTSRLDYIRENPDNQIPIDKLDELARLNKKPVADLTADEIKLIKDAILHEIHLNKLKNKLVFGKEIKDANEDLKIARENILKGGKNLKDDPGAIIDSGETEHRSIWQKLNRIWGIDSLNPEVICEELDHADHGVIMKYVFNGIDMGVTDKLRIMQEADDWLAKELEGIDIDKWSKAFQTKKKNINFQTIKLKGGTLPDGTETLDKKIKITPGEKISFMLHYRNDKNLAHLTDGGFRFSDKTSAKYRLTDENIEQIINSATPEEVKVANVMWKFFNEFIKPELNKASMELNGFEVATEDNYFPIRTLELDRQRDALKARKTFHDKTLEGMGIFKERINAKNALIIEDAFSVITKHLEQTSSYIGLAKPLRFAKFFLEDTELQENIMKVHGKEYLENLKDYLKMIEDESTNVENIDKLTTELINKLDVAILGLHPFVSFKQPVSYLVASTEMDAKYLAKGAKTKTNIEEIKYNSPQLRQRFEGHITRELGEISNVGKTRQLFLHKSPINTKYLAGIRYMDLLTIGKIWNAVKLEISDKYPGLSGEDYIQKVTERAEEIIRRTQPTWHPKDRSAIGRSRSIWLRLMTKYTSQRNKNRIILKRSTLRYNRSDKNSKDKIRLIKDYSKVMIISALLITAIDELRNRAYGKKSRGAVAYVIDTLGTALGTFYIVGDLFTSLASKIQRGTYAGFDATGNIVVNWIDGAVDALAETTRTIDQLATKEKYASGTKKGEEKWKTSIMKALDKSASSLLTVAGIPYDNVRKLLEGTLKMAGDKEEPKQTTKTKRTGSKTKTTNKEKRFTK